MNVLEIERERISAALRSAPLGEPLFHELYAAGCALAWASDQEMFSSPLDYIEGRANDKSTHRAVVKEDYPSSLCLASS